MAKKFRKLRKGKRVKHMVPDAIAEKASELNPLPKAPEQPRYQDAPQVTTESIAKHREEVLKGARKYIYPLQHSKRTIIVVTISVIITAIIGLMVYCSLALYKFYQYNTFLYRVSQVIPFPVAKAGSHYVIYEDYLFELRHYVHYYENQQQRNFNGSDHEQLVTFRKQALENVISYAYIKQLAAKNGVSVSNKEVNARLEEVRNQNRLGGNDRVFGEVLHDYWGWSIKDFKRSLKQEILTEKVAAKLDTSANRKAVAILTKARATDDFSELAKKVSDDPAAKQNGGDYGFAISKTNPNVPPEVVNNLFKMKVGDISDVILASPVLAGQGPTLQIVKLTGIAGDTVTAKHIVIKLNDPATYIKGIKAQKPAHLYVHF